ncbi:hypothetical protein BDV10DRAFT_182961 [Aspergillus recurvatus]
MEPASLALGVIGLTGMFDACLKLYEHISNARRLPEDCQRHALFLDWEKTRFALICDELLRGIKDLPATTTEKSVPGGASQLSQDGLAQPLTSAAVWKHECLGRVLRMVESVLMEAQAIVEKYERSDSKRRLKDRISSKFHARKLSWIADDKNRLKELIDSLRQLNAYLEQILPAASRQRLQLAFEATVILAADLGRLQDLQTQPSTIGYEDLQRGATVRAAKLTLESDLPGVVQRVQDFRIHYHRICLRKPIEASHNVYSSAVYEAGPDGSSCKKTVLLERRQVFTTTGSIRKAETRLNNLVTALQAMTPPSNDTSSGMGFGVPRCVGWIAPDSSDPDLDFIELVYEYPGSPSTPPVSLHTLLQTLVPKSRPPLGVRFHFALCLARYYARFVSVGYFHKGMHSHNILFFDGIERPYIVGCAEARAESSPEFSSPLSDSIADRELYLPWETILGNGESDHSKRPRWSAATDIYGLGVMLLELGHWTSASEAWKTESLYDFHHKIIPELVDGLGYQVGVIYKNVVEFCLKMDSAATELGVWEQYTRKVLEQLELCRA